MDAFIPQLLGLLALVVVLTFVLLVIVAVARPEQLPRIVAAVERIIRIFKNGKRKNHEHPPE